MNTIPEEAQRLADRLRAAADEILSAARYGVPIPYMVSASGHKFGAVSFAATEAEFAAWVEYTEAEVEHNCHHGADWSNAEADVNGLPVRFSARHEAAS